MIVVIFLFFTQYCAQHFANFSQVEHTKVQTTHIAHNKNPYFIIQVKVNSLTLFLINFTLATVTTMSSDNNNTTAATSSTTTWNPEAQGWIPRIHKPKSVCQFHWHRPVQGGVALPVINKERDPSVPPAHQIQQQLTLQILLVLAHAMPSATSLS